jgi:hypothetical protein
MRKVLFSRDSECIQPIRELIEKQKHRTLVLWVLDCAPRVLEIFEERYPQEKRPREAFEATKAWAQGDIKMPIAKKAAHATHNAATEVVNDLAACAAARTMGHVVGTVHGEGHALGVVFYGLTAFIRAADPKDADAVTQKELAWFYDRLLYWEANIDKVDLKWASFLLRDDVPNNERLLRENKTQNKKREQER